MLKSELRKEIRQRKRQFTQRQLGELSLAVVAKLLAHPRVRSARTVMMYYSLADEVCTHEAIDTLCEQGKRVVLPVVVGPGSMELRLYTGQADLREGAFGIMEPCGEPFGELGLIDVAVVPGMAFDDSLHRLGRGRGYYDRFLPLLPQAYKIGVCFGFQKVEAVPTDAYDISMDEVIASASADTK